MNRLINTVIQNLNHIFPTWSRKFSYFESEKILLGSVIFDSVFGAAEVIRSLFSHNSLVERLLEPTRHEYLSLIYKSVVFGKLAVQKQKNQEIGGKNTLHWPV